MSDTTTPESAPKQDRAPSTTKARPPTLRERIEPWLPTIRKALPAQIDIDRFMTGYWTAARSAPKLNACTPESIISALLTCAELELMPSPGLKLVHLIPRENKKRNSIECTLVIGYAGLLHLAGAAVKAVNCSCVHEADFFDLDLGEPRLEHRPALRQRGPIIGAYCVLTLASGGEQMTWMPREEIEAIRDRYAPDHDNALSPWVVNLGEMCRKTVLRRALKTVPLGTDTAARLDRAERSERGRVIEPGSPSEPPSEPEGAA
jgi:recombination protein RecT